MKIDWAGAITNANIGKIYINGEEFTGIGYQGLLTVNTKTYVTEPTRGNDGSISNINDHDTFIVPRCKVNFKFFNIQDYMRLCQVVNSGNEFPVSYFDKQFGKFVTHMMYCEPEEMYKMFNVSTSVIGVLDYEISFIGTLNDLQSYEVKYITSGFTARTYNEYSSATTNSLNDIVKSTDEQENVYYYKYINATSESGKPLTNTEYWKQIYKTIDDTNNVKWGNSIKVLTATDLSDWYVIPTGKQFLYWNTKADGTGYRMLPNANFTIFESMDIYPILGDV